MLVSEFDYSLPPELIAQFPSENRVDSRMLVVDRKSNSYVSDDFRNILNYFNAGDCLVINDTRVINARLFGQKESTGGKVEILVLNPIKEGFWKVLIRPGKRIKCGTKININGEKETTLRVIERNSDGTFHIDFSSKNVHLLLAQYGNMPLPPYIRRQNSEMDGERYQTVYADKPGAVAAPTAGLHFDEQMMNALRKNKIKVAPVTLHVGLGTFKPVSVANVENHLIHSENFSLSQESASLINETRKNGGLTIAVGTTSARVLETCAADNGTVRAAEGRTRLFLHPPAKPRIADALLTNFHLPKSTLLMLVCTFSPYQTIMGAYRYAIKNQYRFYSYGDCMLLI